VKIPGVLPPVSVASWPKLFGPEATAASILDSRVAVRSDDAGAPAGDGCGGGVAGEVTGVAAGDEDGAGVGAKPDGAGAEAVDAIRLIMKTNTGRQVVKRLLMNQLGSGPLVGPAAAAIGQRVTGETQGEE
jgi:hypothetical protein